MLSTISIINNIRIVDLFVRKKLRVCNSLTCRAVNNKQFVNIHERDISYSSKDLKKRVWPSRLRVERFLHERSKE